MGRPRTPDTRSRKPCCSVKPVRHISMFDPTLPGVSLVSMYGLGVYTPALPDVCVVARSSSVLMQAILLFVFTSYCYVTLVAMATRPAHRIVPADESSQPMMSLKCVLYAALLVAVVGADAPAAKPKRKWCNTTTHGFAVRNFRRTRWWSFF